MQLSDYAEQLVVNHFLRNQAHTPTSQVFLALFSTATTDAGGGTEAVGGSYARKPITIAAPSAGASSNSAALTFPNMPAGTWTHAAIIDAVTAGNFLWHGALTTPKTTTAGQQTEVLAGELDVGFTAGCSATDYLRNAIINRLLRNQAFTPPATLYMGLYTTATNRSGGGTEVTGAPYVRQTVTLVAPAGGVTSNAAEVGIPSPDATSTHLAIIDAVTAGNMLLQGPLDSSINSDAGDVVRFATGAYDLVVT